MADLVFCTGTVDYDKCTLALPTAARARAASLLPDLLPLGGLP